MYFRERGEKRIICSQRLWWDGGSERKGREEKEPKWVEVK